jgi:phage tail sheath protein FI
MANPTYPGVYVEEVASGVRPIEAVGTSTPAFVGFAEMGPDDEARRITSWTEYQRYYGGFIADGYLAESVFQFFNNGGRQCYVVRVTRSGTQQEAGEASATVQNSAETPTKGLMLTARSKGVWGNSLIVTIEDGTLDPSNELKLTIRRQAKPEVVPERLAEQPALEVHDNLSMDPDAPNFLVSALATQSHLIDATVPATNDALQPGTYRGGLDPALPLEERRSFVINLDGDGPQPVTLPDTFATSKDLEEVAAAIQEAVRALRKQRASTPDDSFSDFTCSVGTADEHRRLLLRSGASHARSSIRIAPAEQDNAVGKLRLGAADGAVAQDAFAPRRPPNIPALQIGDNVESAPVTSVVPGSDGKGPTKMSAFTKAFALLDTKTDFSLLAVPGENSPSLVDEAMGYCGNRPLRDVFYIGEMTKADVTPEHAERFAKALNRRNSYGAVYFPWIKAADPSGRSAEPVLLPPSGYIAGLYARIDANRGVWKAPAGTSASLSGAVGLASELTDTEHGNLNPLGINVIRRFATSGIVIFGARTICSDVEWKYAPVRRLAIMLRVSIYYGMQWAVFEPNDELLWSQLRLNIGSFMMTLFRQGAFQGTTPTDAFFVKCDAETTTPADIDRGVVNVLVGFAPLRPAEFVIVRISQKAGQAA